MQVADFLKKLPLSEYTIHFIGIGGIGMSALAEILCEGGFKVSGSDAEYNSTCRYLAGMGVNIAPAGHREENIPADGCAAAIMTSAAQQNNPEAVKLLRDNIITWGRGEFLGELCRCYKRTVMVAGSHGKSSTSAMLGWILRKLGNDAGLVIGARYNSSERNARLGSGDILVGEADESDNTHALLSGELALVTNIDGDHAWSKEAVAEQEQKFRIFGANFRKTLYLASENCRRIFANCPNAEPVSEEKFKYMDSLVPGNMLGFERTNAVLALTGAEYLGFDPVMAAEALKSYPGIRRRQTVIMVSPDNCITVLEDYAHHPHELACSLEVIRLRYPAHKLTVVFQPHRYRRLLRYFDDFVRILSDKTLSVKVLPVFCAWEQLLIDGRESADLVAAINAAGGKAELLSLDAPERSAETLLKECPATEQTLIALIGAGDIDRLTKCFQCKSEE
ncbi:MAG: hypothetical protein IKD10_13280 [Lentisphaeria bacterium]|nr:hypothetical protein [Lentisphaeria bacterium]